MTQNKNVTKSVWNVINKDLSVKRDLSRGLISLRALARFIIKEYHLNASVDAVMSAIRRYEQDDRFEAKYHEAERVIAKSKLATKSGIVNIAMGKNDEIKNILPKIFSEINFSKGDVLRISQAEQSIKVIIDEKNLERILAIVPKKHIINIEKGLAEINIQLVPEATDTPGIIAEIFLALMDNGVVVRETMSCVPEMLIFVKEKDLILAHKTLYDLIQRV